MNVLWIAGSTSLLYISFVKTSVAKSWKEVSEATHFPSEGPHVEGCGRKGATETETIEKGEVSRTARNVRERREKWRKSEGRGG